MAGNTPEEKFRALIEDLGKPTLRGVRRCPKCGTLNGTRGISCKNKSCDVVFKEREKKKGHSADAVKIITGSTVQVYSVRLRDRGPDYRGFVQLPLVQDLDGNPADNVDPVVLESAGRCYVDTCSKSSRGHQACSHIKAAVECTEEAQPLTLKNSVLNSLQVSSEMKQDIWLLATETSGPLVQRVTKNIMVVKCKPYNKHPLGFLHFSFFETCRNRTEPEFKFQCSCRLFKLKLNSAKEEAQKRCVHFYACICAFASDDQLTEEFSPYINLDSFSCTSPVDHLLVTIDDALASTSDALDVVTTETLHTEGVVDDVHEELVNEDFVHHQIALKHETENVEVIVQDETILTLHPDSLHTEVLHTEVLQGETLQGDSLHGDSLHGDTLQGEVLHGEVLHGEVLHEETLHGEVLHSDDLHGECLHTEVLDNEVLHSEVLDSDGLQCETLHAEVLHSEQLQPQAKRMKTEDILITTDALTHVTSGALLSLHQNSVNTVHSAITVVKPISSMSSAMPPLTIQHATQPPIQHTVQAGTTLKKSITAKSTPAKSSTTPKKSGEEPSVVLELSFMQWLSSVSERINQTMHYQFDGNPEPLVFHAPQKFFEELQRRISAGSKKKRLPNFTTGFVRKDALPLGTFTKYTWYITSIFHVKQIFDTAEMPLEITKSFVENRDGTYDLYEQPPLAADAVDLLGKTPIRPFELKTFLKVGVTSPDQKDPTPFVIEWIPDILPKTRIGELRIKFEYGHKRNGQIDHRSASTAQPTELVQTVHIQTPL